MPVTMEVHRNGSPTETSNWDERRPRQNHHPSPPPGLAGQDRGQARTTLSFSVQLRRPRSPDAAEITGSEDNVSPSDCQAINITFDDDFVPSTDAPLNFHLRDGHLNFTRTPLHLDHDDPSHNICVIDTAVALLFDTLDSDLDERRTPDPPSHSDAGTRRNWPWICVPLTLSILVLYSLYVRLGLPPSQPANGAASRPSEHHVQIRHAALGIFDEITELLRTYVEAPLPFFVGAQDLIDRHYAVPNIPRPPTRAPPTKAVPIRTTAPVFLGHVVHATAQLCDHFERWLIRSRSPLFVHDDIVLLCTALQRHAGDLSPLWHNAAATLALSWFASFDLVTFHLVDAFKSRAVPVDADRADAFGCFYNRTSHILIRDTHEILFATGARQETRDPGLDPSLFAKSLYDAAGELQGLLDTLLPVITHTNILLETLKDSGVTANIPADPPWFARRRSAADLAQVSAAQDEVTPLLATTVSFAWIISTTHQSVKRMVADLERIGNQSNALWNFPLPVCHDRPDWWCGSAWVTEISEYDMPTRTFWYVPHAGSLASGFAELMSWGLRQLRRTQREWRWTTSEAERYHRP